MDDYLHCMRTLRSQINDVEDQVAKVSVEEQTLVTTIQTLDRDICYAKSEAIQIKEDTEKMVKAMGKICSKILERQKTSASLELELSTLSQTLELIQQERIKVTATIKDKRVYYDSVIADATSKLQQLEDGIHSNQVSVETEIPPGLMAMDIERLRNEHDAVLSDKASALEYLQSLKSQQKKLEEVSQTVTCSCGTKLMSSPDRA